MLKIGEKVTSSVQVCHWWVATMLRGGGLGGADGGSCLFRSVKIVLPLLISLVTVRSAALPAGGIVAMVG